MERILSHVISQTPYMTFFFVVKMKRKCEPELTLIPKRKKSKIEDEMFSSLIIIFGYCYSLALHFVCKQWNEAAREFISNYRGGFHEIIYSYIDWNNWIDGFTILETIEESPLRNENFIELYYIGDISGLSMAYNTLQKSISQFAVQRLYRENWISIENMRKLGPNDMNTIYLNCYINKRCTSVAMHFFKNNIGSGNWGDLFKYVHKKVYTK